MAKINNLSNNLKSYQKDFGYTLSEFSNELDIPRSTLQAIMIDGNTTLATLIHIASVLNVSLDELVFGNTFPLNQTSICHILKSMSWYTNLSEDKQNSIIFHINEILKEVKN